MVTVTNPLVSNIDRAIQLIDEGIAGSWGRNLTSTGELTDLLLDIRRALTNTNNT